MSRAIAIAAAAVVAVVLFVVLRPETEEEAAPPPTVAEQTTTAEPPEVEEPERTAPESPGETVVNVVVRDGKPVAGIVQVRVEQGETVVIAVRSDVADHVHVHGYDLTADVAPGAPARIRFVADAPGRFEVELEERGVPLAELTVR